MSNKIMLNQNTLWFNPIAYNKPYINILKKNIINLNKTIYPISEDCYIKIEPTKDI